MTTLNTVKNDSNCMEEKPTTRIQQLVQDLTDKHVTGIGARSGYFEAVPKLKFGLVSFSLGLDEEPNARVIEDNLHLDLWFNPERTVEAGILAEQVINGQRLIKQTVVLTDIDYINKNNLRQYW